FNREINRIDQTEMEDEAVVESVQKGLQSRFYTYGRFSPTQEQGVHHFHRLVANFLNL
ncbi:MAG: SRPBCC family protein, partial [Saprospiraceae bacterium]